MCNTALSGKEIQEAAGQAVSLNHAVVPAVYVARCCARVAWVWPGRNGHPAERRRRCTLDRGGARADAPCRVRADK
jgi:hypothetical protein